MSAPFDLAIDSGGDQFPVTGGNPRLSWRLPLGEQAAGFQLEGHTDSDSLGAVTLSPRVHSWVPWPWRDLRSRERVRWRVRVINGDWSPWHSFEVGLRDGDWIARWVTPVDMETHEPGRRPAYTVSTEFTVDVEVTEARLYATALGVYEAFLNGGRAGTAQLSPGASSYDSTLYAQASDVTASIRQGGNRLEAVVSDGWFRGRVGAFRAPAQWGSELGLRAELHLELSDGTHRVIATGADWVSAPSTIVSADLMEGQITDFEAATSPTQPVLLDRVAAPSLEWSPAPPVRVIEVRRPVAITGVRESVTVVDFGQNASGWVVLTDLGRAGTRTILEYGEFQDATGDLSTTHLDSRRPGEPPAVFSQRDEVVSDGIAPEFEPRHTVHGFQFVRVTREGAAFDPTSIEMRVVHTDLRSAAAFTSSNADLNRLHELAAWSFRGNAVDIPTDCPTRERLGWTGDYQIFAPTATRLYDVSGFTRKWLRAVRDDQLDDGRIANFSPDGKRIRANPESQLAMMTGSAGWGDAIIAVPWEMYRAYGDVAFLADNWDAMQRWNSWALETARTSRHPSRIERSAEPLEHEQFIWDGSFHWGEWIEPKKKGADGTLIDPVQDDPVTWFMADKGEVGTAYLYRSTRTLAEVAGVIGRRQDAASLQRLADRIREAWQVEFLGDDGRTATDTQAAYVRALSFELIPMQLRSASAARLVELVRAADDHLTTGFLSTGDLLPVLADHGHPDVAFDVLLQRTSPSWLNMVDKGASTIWEDWDGIDEHGRAHESLNHYSKGAVVRFLHTHVLGLRQATGSVGWESVVIEPTPHSTVTWARGTYEAVNGTIQVDWRVEGGELCVAVDLPAGTTGTVVLPDRSRIAISEGRSTISSEVRSGSVLR